MSEPRSKATYEDLVALPSNVVGELIGGAVSLAAPPPRDPGGPSPAAAGAATLDP